MGILKKFQYNSPVILTYTIMAFAAVVIGYLTNGAANALLFSVYRSSLTEPLFYIRLVGHVFGHGDFGHYFNNFIIILLIGPMLEEKYGSKNLALLMLVTSICTGILHILLFKTALLGASGIVFFMILLASYANFERGRIPITLILVIIIFLGREIISSFLITDDIARITHVFGGVIGAVSGYFYNNNKLSLRK